MIFKMRTGSVTFSTIVYLWTQWKSTEGEQQKKAPAGFDPGSSWHQRQESKPLCVSEQKREDIFVSHDCKTAGVF